jgi:hypothetical protein
MTAHTAGTWCVRGIPTQSRYIGPADDGGAPSIAFVLSVPSRSEAELDANARLIAAAPDILAALEMIRDADDDCSRDGLPTIPKLARAKIDTAIAKATGSAT